MTKIAELLIVAVWTSFFCGTAAWAGDAREAIESGNRALIAALLEGDAEAVADRYTGDARVIPPGAEAARGHSAIAAFWQGAIDAGVKDLSLETAEVESVGDLAFEAGVLKMVASDDEVTEARYVVVWKRENGIWKLHRDIWNLAK